MDVLNKGCPAHADGFCQLGDIWLKRSLCRQAGQQLLDFSYLLLIYIHNECQIVRNSEVNYIGQ